MHQCLCGEPWLPLSTHRAQTFLLHHFLQDFGVVLPFFLKICSHPAVIFLTVTVSSECLGRCAAKIISMLKSHGQLLKNISTRKQTLVLWSLSSTEMSTAAILIREHNKRDLKMWF